MSYLYFQYIPRTGPDALPDWACEPVPMPVDSSLKFIAPFHGPLLPTPSVYCKHGTFIGGPLGPDYICGWCEQGDEPGPDEGGQDAPPF